MIFSKRSLLSKNISFLVFPTTVILMTCSHPLGKSDTASLSLMLTISERFFIPQQVKTCDNAMELLLFIQSKPLLSRTLAFAQENPRGEVTFDALVPGKDYRLLALFGFASPSQPGATCEAVRVVRAFADARFDLHPFEEKELNLVLKECSEPVEGRPCRSSFAGEVSPPTLLLYPDRTGCNSLALAISKGTDTTLRVNNRDLEESNFGYVYYRVSLTEQGPASYFFQTVKDHIPSRIVTATVEYKRSSLCFDPYPLSSTHFIVGSNSFTFRWDRGNLTGNLYLVLTSTPDSLKARMNDAEIQVLNPITIPLEQGATSGYNLTTFPSPPWYSGLYVQEEGFWIREGALSYIPQWFDERREIK